MLSSGDKWTRLPPADTDINSVDKAKQRLKHTSADPHAFNLPVGSWRPGQATQTLKCTLLFLDQECVATSTESDGNASLRTWGGENEEREVEEGEVEEEREAEEGGGQRWRDRETDRGTQRQRGTDRATGRLEASGWRT
ncbi:unnamed protein product [Pleuronectes platessa]|uniref:Uncharacterized protein n=1 Tax=Pleuronectes platessa TaxID=8262 RepID=A0A9N7Y5M5_PLEPL|nr:unnamed protein product [Pleuronectes platessa]